MKMAVFFYILIILLAEGENAEKKGKKGIYTRAVKPGEDVVLSCDLKAMKGELDKETTTIKWEYRSQFQKENGIIASKVPGKEPVVFGLNRYDFNTSNWSLTILKMSSYNEGHYTCYVKRNITAVEEKYVYYLYISACTVKDCSKSNKDGNMVVTFSHPSQEPGKSFVDVDLRAECNNKTVNICTVPFWYKFNGTDATCKLFPNSETGHQIIVANGTKFLSCKVMLDFWKDGDCWKHPNTALTVVAKSIGEITTNLPVWSSPSQEQSTTMMRGLLEKSTTLSTAPNTMLDNVYPTSLAVKSNFSLKLILSLLLGCLDIYYGIPNDLH